MQDKIEKLSKSVDNLKNKNFTVYFFTIEEKNPCSTLFELYNQANVLRKDGYNVVILTDDQDYTVPDFLDDELKTIPTKSAKENLMISPEDFLIIPEIFTNVLEQTKNVNCNKIVLAQSYYNTLKGLLPGMSWRRDYNIQNVITNSDNMTKFVQENLDGNYDIKQYTLGIPDYFKVTKRPKDLTVSLFGRNPQEVSNIIKLFYLKNPQYRFITFQDLRGKKRKEFAEILNKSAIALSVDRHAVFGTFPVEAMKSGNIVVGLAPEQLSEYINENNGLWSQNSFDIPELLKTAIQAYLEDNIPDEIYKAMEETVSKYTPEISEKTIKETYEYFVNKRINEFEAVLEQIKTLETTEK